MSDNSPEDTYIYEVLVQTGPMLSHGTESKVRRDRERDIQ